MKNSKTLFALALLASVLFSNCSTDDRFTLEDDTSGLPCQAVPKDLLVLNTLFDGANNAQIAYNTFAINGLDSSLPNSLGNLATNTNMTFQLPTGASLYNQASNLHGLLVTRAGKYFTFNTDTGVGQEFVVPTIVSAPVQLNTSSYVIEVANFGYTDQGIENHFEIKPFNINDGAIGAALPIDQLDRTFDNNSFFNVESMSSATNEIDSLYFLSGTNLVTVNTLNNTATHIDLYPPFTYSNFVRFFGLEYSENLGLIAIMDDSNAGTQYVVKIDPLSGNQTNLVILSENINSEFYSTTYRECDKTYFLTSLKHDNNLVETLYFEFNLATNTLENSQIFQDYAFGIQLIPQETP